MMLQHRTDQNTLAFLQTNVTAFIEPPNWTSDSLDLNHMDCLIWVAL